MIKQVKIFGERHTGTNAMRELVTKNFGFEVGNHGPLGWKHRIAPNKRELSKHNMGETLVIMLVRNPYTWMEAMHRDPYNYHDPEGHKVPYDRYIRTPFEDYANLPSCWNRKNKSYFDLSLRVPNAMIFKMEDLASRPHGVFEALEKWLKPTSDIFYAPPYWNGRSAGPSSKEKVGNIKHFIEVSPKNQDFASEYLDSFLMQVFDYPMSRGTVSV